MAISVDCDECGYSFNAADKFAGKLIRCPDCSEAIRVGSSSSGSSKSSGSQPAAARSQARSSRSSKARSSRSTSERSARPSRPARRGRGKKRASKNNAVMIGGGVTIVALLGVIAAMAMGGGEDPAPAETDATLVETPSGGSADLIAQARQQDAAEQAKRKRLAMSAAAKNKAKFGDGGLSGVLSGSDKVMASNDSSRKATQQIDLSAQNGDRVSWLFRDGTGFARKEDMWVYRGDPGDLGMSSRSSVLTLPFYETLRTESMVELFNQQHSLRVRLKKSEFIAFDLKRKTEKPMNGGQFANSTSGAASWLSDAELPADRMRQTAVESGDLVSLIANVEKQVARIDVITPEGSGNGSGFLVDESGRIVTNYHVIEGCTAARAVFTDAGEDGGKVEVKITGFLHVDPKRDIAVIQAVLPPDFKFRGLPLAKKTAKGESVVAFGAPLGLDSTASEGIISGYRTAEQLKETLGVDGHAGNWVQTTTPISPGNSGGPLVNRSGEVVAINTMTLTIGQQLNFAISADDIKRAIDLSEPTPKSMSPQNLPIAAHRAARSRGAAPGSRAGRSGKRIAISTSEGTAYLWPIEGTPEAAKYLAELDEVLLSVVSRYEMMETVIGESARKSLRGTGVRVVIDEGPVLLIVPQTRRASKNYLQLELFAHLYVVRNGEALRIWRGSAGDAGRISPRSLREGKIGSKMKGSISRFFEGLAKSISDAKNGEGDSAAQDDDPFKGR